MAGYGVGASLAGLGQSQQHQALGALRSAAEQESQRNRENKALTSRRRPVSSNSAPRWGHWSA